MSLTHTQHIFNRRMARNGQAKYHRIKSGLIDKHSESTTEHGRLLMKKIHTPTCELLKKELENSSNKVGVGYSAFPFIRKLDIDVVVFLSLKVLINNINKDFSATKMASQIGQALEDEIRFTEFKDLKPHFFKSIMERMEGDNYKYYKKRKVLNLEWNKLDSIHGIEKWTNIDRIKVGTKLLDVIIRASGIIEIDTQQQTKKRKTSIIKPTQLFIEFVSNYDELREYATPEFYPSVLPLIPWEDQYTGAYPLIENLAEEGIKPRWVELVKTPFKSVKYKKINDLIGSVSFGLF